jgi:phosphoglycolate phosphatase-like HAD superfamily hydrolase
MRLLALIADLDGTLFTLGTDWTLLKKKLSLFSKKYGFHSAFTHLDPEVEKFIAFLHGSFDQKKASSIKSALYKMILKEELEGVPSGKEVKGATELLDKLHPRNIKLGVVSGNSRKTVAGVIKKMDWKVDAIIGREDTSKAKPDSQGVIKCLAKLKVAPDKCWAVGNRQKDIDAYMGAGISKTFLLGKDITKLSQIYE